MRPGTTVLPLPRVRDHCVVWADCDDPIGCDGHRLHNGRSGIDRNNVTVLQNEVGWPYKRSSGRSDAPLRVRQMARGESVGRESARSCENTATRNQIVRHESTSANGRPVRQATAAERDETHAASPTAAHARPVLSEIAQFAPRKQLANFPVGKDETAE